MQSAFANAVGKMAEEEKEEMENSDSRLLRIPLPAENAMTRQVQELWRACFGEEEVRDTSGQFAGEDRDFDDDILYVIEYKGVVASSCHVTRKRGTGMAGFGGVATVPEFRGMGFSRQVCSFALKEFDEAGGDVIWLGTGNPAAANLYHELGFAFLPGTQVMCRLRKGLTNTKFLDSFFGGNTATVKSGSAACRIPMIPLMTSRLGFTVMDRVTGYCGSEKILEGSCMGLYPAYEAVRRRGGDWFCLDSGEGRIGGIGSWKPMGDGTAIVDACWHANYRAQAAELLRTLIADAKTAGCSVRLAVADVDAAKAEMAVELGAVKGVESLWEARRGVYVRMNDYLV